MSEKIQTSPSCHPPRPVFETRLAIPVTDSLRVGIFFCYFLMLKEWIRESDFPLKKKKTKKQQLLMKEKRITFTVLSGLK